MIVCFTLATIACSAARAERSQSIPSRERGFLFLEGRYLEPPNAIELEDDVLRVNGRQILAGDLDLRGLYGPNLSERERWQRLCFSLNDANRCGCVIVLFRNHRPLILKETRLGARLIGLLSGKPYEQDAEIDELPQRECDRLTWARLVSEFESTPEFLARASEHLNRLESVCRKNTADAEQNVWLDRIDYPLTVFAMVIVVLAFGHLVSTRPYVPAHTVFATEFPSPRQTVLRSLLIVGLLSIVDLIWTLASYEAGTMRELNPMGRTLVDQPLHLMLFKTATIAPAMGSMYWLHRLPLAQAASWWSCLVLTLVTARWLIFSSMFL